MLQVIRDWRASVEEEMVEASELAEHGEVFFERILMKTYFQAWLSFMAPMRAKEALGEIKADEWWCDKTREILFRRWRDRVRRITARRAKMIELQLFILPVEFQNSSRQRPTVERVVMFHRRRVLRKAWDVFVNLNAELADLQRRLKVSDTLTVCRKCCCGCFTLRRLLY